MKQIIEYLKDNLTYIWVFLGSVLAFLLIFFLIKFLVEKLKKNKIDKTKNSAENDKENSDMNSDTEVVSSNSTDKEIDNAQVEKDSAVKITKSDKKNIVETKTGIDKKSDGEKSVKVAEKENVQAETVENSSKENVEKTNNVKKTEKQEEQTGKQTVGNDKEDSPVKYAGKWKIKKTDDGYMASLYASNGVLMLNSETYSSLNGAKNGIETIKKNVTVGNFTIKEDKHGYFNFRLTAPNKRVVCIGESYDNRSACEAAMTSFKKFALNCAYTEIESEKED